MKLNNRLNRIPAYHFQKLDEIKSKLIEQGKEITDLSIGDPDIPVDDRILKALTNGLKVSEFNKYPPYDGIKQLKTQIIKYYEEVYSVQLDMEEVLILIGSKEGINNLIPAVCDIGDYAIVPQLAYPVYNICSSLWGVKTYTLPLIESLGYLPRFEFIPADILVRSKLMALNYPNNPTGAVANEEFYKSAVDFCEKNDIVLFNDAAYNEIVKEIAKPISILTSDPKHRSLEFGTFSKSYNMTGFRVGYAVGNRDVIKALLKIKSNVDSGQFIPIQLAAYEALNIEREYFTTLRRIYDERRVTALEALDNCNIKYFNPEGTFYIWCNVPRNYTAREFCTELLQNHGIIVTSGEAFGDISHSHFRIALTKDSKIIKKALGSLKYYD